MVLPMLTGSPPFTVPSCPIPANSPYPSYLPPIPRRHDAPRLSNSILRLHSEHRAGWNYNFSSQFNHQEGGAWQIVDAACHWVDTGIQAGEIYAPGNSVPDQDRLPVRLTATR